MEFHRERHRSACFVTAEIYVERLLTRDEFRRHCGHYGNHKAIVGNLA